MNQDNENERATSEALRVRNQELAAQVRRLVAQLALSEQAERRRLSQLLHDDLQQRLYVLQYLVTGLLNGEGSSTQESRKTIGAIKKDLDGLVQYTRSLSANLNPPVLYSGGLAEAVRWLAGQMEDQYGLSVAVQADDVPVPADDLRFLLFQIVRELLLNVVKHGGVTRAEVVLTRTAQRIHIEVIDHGVGFDVEVITSDLVRSPGLDQIQWRLHLVGGHLQIESSPGEGTRMVLECPLGDDVG